MILDEIVSYTKERVINKKEEVSFHHILKKVEKLPISYAFPFEASLKGKGFHFICEVKKASPSKGILVDSFDYIQIAKDYEEAGASCISVLTEPRYFKGEDKYLKKIREEVSIPLLRKDFIVDSYQIYESKLLGADCILLICSILSKEELLKYLAICNELGLSALVEAHDEREVHMAVEVGARMIGVNNRNLRNFEVNINNSINLRRLVPDSVLFIAESGIKTREDVLLCREHNISGILIGETLMKSTNKKEALSELGMDRV